MVVLEPPEMEPLEVGSAGVSIPTKPLITKRLINSTVFQAPFFLLGVVVWGDERPILDRQ